MSQIETLKPEFKGKRVLITGAGRGLGRALVKRLHGYGATVIALSKTKANLRSLEAECPGVKTICVNLENWDETRSALINLEAVDCLVNNAAIVLVKSGMQTSRNELEMIMNTNFQAPYNICQLIGAKMIEAGIRGSIVNISSGAGTRAVTPLLAAYSISKAALQMMTKVFATELGKAGIRVNCVQFGGFASDMLAQLAAGVEEVTKQPGSLEQILMSRMASDQAIIPMDECVNSVLFLLSDLTSQIMGHSLALDGGFLCT